MPLQTSAFRAQRNAKALARLEKSLPAIFPALVLAHARRMPFIPPTPRLCVESYWRRHPLRADRLARALARKSGAPENWRWRLADGKAKGLPASFRTPPAPYREEAFARGPSACCVCGQPVFRLGWHVDLWGAGPNKNAGWHAACVVAWGLWTTPSDHLKLLRRVQRRRCGAIGDRLLKDAEVDHRTPLYEVWRQRASHTWPDLLAFWGAPNLQAVNKTAHLDKSIRETGARAVAAADRNRIRALLAAGEHGPLPDL